MATLLVLVLFFTLLLGQVAATNPSMDPSLSTSPIMSFYPDPDGMLDAICEFCGFSIDYCLCVHALSNRPRRASTFTANTFLSHPEWPRDPIPDLDELLDFETEEELPPLCDDKRPSLNDDIVRELNENATTIQPSTIQIYVESTYNPGDRLGQEPPRRHAPRRHAPRPGGFPCTHPACGKIFNRACELNHHAKKHLPPSERLHRCDVCHKGFLYPKDRNRHKQTHDQSSSKATLPCTVAGCDNVTGFSRRDNLLRHQRTKHPHMARS